MISIRDASPADSAAIADVVASAFATVEHSDQTEPAIIDRLRDAGALSLSLIAERDGQVVGHAAFSPVHVEGRDCGWFGLGPLSVPPDCQGEGIGGALVNVGLERLHDLGAAGCVVLGDPGYYGRFGFARDERLYFTGAPPEYFMLLDLPGGDRATRGEVNYHPAFFAS